MGGRSASILETDRSVAMVYAFEAEGGSEEVEADEGIDDVG